MPPPRTLQFHFSFSIGRSQTRVSPLTYADSIEWLESRRRVQLGEQMRDAYQSSITGA